MDTEQVIQVRAVRGSYLGAGSGGVIEGFARSLATVSAGAAPGPKPLQQLTMERNASLVSGGDLPNEGTWGST